MTSSTPRILLYADMRNLHALRWLDGLHSLGAEVRAVSSQIVEVDTGFRSAPDPVSRVRRALVASGTNRRIRGAFARSPNVEGTVAETVTAKRSKPRNPSRVDLVQLAETTITPLRLRSQGALLRSEIETFEPDIVHALRLPYEGIIALTCAKTVPVVVSCWGQDFSRQAASDPLLAAWMRRVLPRAAGFHADALVDFQHAESYGLRSSTPLLHAAGNFGVDTGLFFPEKRVGRIVVVYPRGILEYVHHATFLELVMAFAHDARFEFVGIGLQGDPASESVAQQVPLGRLTLLPRLDPAAYARVLRSADAVVSPSVSDGTPNSLLEALAVGATVFAGDVPSVRDLLRGVEDAFLLDPTDGQEWVQTVERWASDLTEPRSHRVSRLPSLYERAASISRVSAFYQEVISRDTQCR